MQRISDFAENIPLLMCIIDTEGKIISTNCYFNRVTGFSDDEIETMKIFDIITERIGTLRETLTAIFKDNVQKSIKEVDVMIKRKNDVEFPGILTASAWQQHQQYNGNSNMVIGIAVTESSQLAHSKEETEEANKELKRKESLKDEFIAIASHELRTPIQPILGLALLAKKGQISQEEAWDSVLKEARRLTQLANDILDVSRIENGTLRYNFARANVSEIIQYVVNALKTSELGKDIDFSVLIDDAARTTYCDLDRQRITQVLMNVIGNAAKFTMKGSIEIEARADVKNSRYDIRISDTGGGIPEAVLPHMFKKFITKSVGEGEKHGSGLGLFISRAIINAHNGAIYLYNSDSKSGDGKVGATFLIRIPIEQPSLRQELAS